MKEITITDLPVYSGDLTPEWFARVLDIKPPDKLVVTNIGKGIGFLSEVFRYDLSWSGHTPGRTLVIKLPPENKRNRAMAEMTNCLEREVLWYLRQGDSLGLPTPQCLFGGFSPLRSNPTRPVSEWLVSKLPLPLAGSLVQSKFEELETSDRRFILGLSMVEGRSTASGTADVPFSLQALAIIASFHARHWMDPTLLKANKHIERLDRAPWFWRSLYHHKRSLFMRHFGGAADDLLRLADEAQVDFLAIVNRLSSSPTTILHGDYRDANLLMSADNKLTVLDFQVVGHGRASWDVAYFLVTSLHPEFASESKGLLQHYRTVLQENLSGATTISEAEFSEDLQCCFRLFAHRVVATFKQMDTSLSDDPDGFTRMLIERVPRWAHALRNLP